MKTRALTRQKPILLVALGGNALIQKGQEGTSRQQFDNLRVPIGQIAELSLTHNIIITHGNGPQVGNLLLQQECTAKVPKLPLEILVAQTQGQIGYMIESALDEALMKLGIDFRPLVSLITYVVVDRNDPAFKQPSKPIGPVYSQDEISAGLSFPTVLTAKGHRRVVASPKPVTIIEKREIQQLIDMNFIVICCGGGGIPVIRNQRTFSGVDAVIDKDLASALLAREVNADLLVMATDIDGVMADFDTPRQQVIRRVNLDQARALLVDDALGAGSMAPKVAAGLEFAEQTGKRAVITATDKIIAAVKGKAGTDILA
jgi:carbamate kinase